MWSCCKTTRYEIHCNMLRLIQLRLHNRTTRISLDKLQSKKILMCQRVSQEGVILSTLFLVCIHDLVKISMQAWKLLYDLVLWCANTLIYTKNKRLSDPKWMLLTCSFHYVSYFTFPVETYIQNSGIVRLLSRLPFFNGFLVWFVKEYFYCARYVHKCSIHLT